MTVGWCGFIEGKEPVFLLLTLADLLLITRSPHPFIDNVALLRKANAPPNIELSGVAHSAKQEIVSCRVYCVRKIKNIIRISYFLTSGPAADKGRLEPLCFVTTTKPHTTVTLGSCLFSMTSQAAERRYFPTDN